MSRRHILSKAKRNTIVTLVANGSSRRVAAQYIGCAPSTITRTAQRFPDFASELVRAEQLNEIAMLRNIKKAAENPRHWRAAAWLLERTNSDDFVIKQKKAVTPEKMHETIKQFVVDAIMELPARYRKIILKKIQAMQQQLMTMSPTIVIEPASETEPVEDDESSFDESAYDLHPSQTDAQSWQTPLKLQHATQE